MKITLTFDNGPDPETTPVVLEILRRHGILSTFFVLGSKASTPAGSPLVTRCIAAGHRVGNHTWSHRTPLGELDPASATEELQRTHELLQSLGVVDRVFRPFGRAGQIGTHLLNPAVVAWLQAHQYSCVLWNCVPGDWRDPDGWRDRALADVLTRPWSVVVLHDLPTGAMRHLDSFIVKLKEAGAGFEQGFPPECVPIDSGRIVLPLSGYVAGSHDDLDRS